MSHKQTPYTPNFPVTQGYAPPPEYDKINQGASAPPHTDGYVHPPPQAGGYPHLPPSAMPMPQASLLQPGFQPHVVMSAGYPMQASPQPTPMTQGFQPGYAPGYPHPTGPIMQQPGPQSAPGGWMSIPQGLTNCPPGLEYLSLIDHLLVNQKVEMLEAFVGFETNNKYTIKNILGQKIYYAVEDNDCCTRNCCGPARPFDMKIKDNFGKEVIHLNRPLACDSCCFPCCLQRMEVTAPPGTVIGAVEQQWSLCQPSFAVKNAMDETVLTIQGPMCTMSMCGAVKFYVYSKDGSTKVGKITKEWSGLAREAFTDSDMFGISFPMDLDVKVKAVLLGACFLIDYMYFESGNNRNN